MSNFQFGSYGECMLICEQLMGAALEREEHCTAGCKMAELDKIDGYKQALQDVAKAIAQNSFLAEAKHAKEMLENEELH